MYSYIFFIFMSWKFVFSALKEKLLNPWSTKVLHTMFLLTFNNLFDAFLNVMIFYFGF